MKGTLAHRTEHEAGPPSRTDQLDVRPPGRAGEPAPADAKAAPGRQRLLDELVDELSSHTPADVIRFMRRWPSGPLSLVHLHVLTVLDEGPVAMRTLAESLDVSQASATGIVDRMEQRGLIARHRDDEDRRVIRVALTQDGRELLAGVAQERRKRLAIVLNELSDDELDGFLRGSRALREARVRLAARWVLPESVNNPTRPTNQDQPIDEESR
jgi:DNA-binding MarR family transcriptional regulator